MMTGIGLILVLARDGLPEILLHGIVQFPMLACAMWTGGTALPPCVCTYVAPCHLHMFVRIWLLVTTRTIQSFGVYPVNPHDNVISFHIATQMQHVE